MEGPWLQPDQAEAAQHFAHRALMHRHTPARTALPSKAPQRPGTNIQTCDRYRLADAESTPLIDVEDTANRRSTLMGIPRESEISAVDIIVSA